MDKRIWKPLAMTLAVSAASVSYAHADVDIDNDGLIEISTLQELDLMRYDLAGTSLNGDSTGCPAAGCNGYELVADLDFDTNENGIADADDLFWNGGAGWEPIGTLQNSFEAIFNGNNHTLANLYINRSNLSYVGLFSVIKNAFVEKMNLSNTWISGEQSSGSLVGTAVFSTISTCQVMGSVRSDVYAAGGVAGSMVNSSMSNCDVTGEVKVLNGFSFFGAAGGLVGDISDSTIAKSNFSGTVLIPTDKRFAGGLVGLSNESGIISDSFAYADVSGGFGVGGILGYAMGVGSSVERSYAVGSVTGSPAYSVGGVVGYANNPVVITSSYWDSDVNGITTASNGEGKTTFELQCPTMPGDVTCDASMYSDWDEAIWDFGTASDYPVLR